AGTEQGCALGEALLGSAPTTTVIRDTAKQGSTTRRQVRARPCARRSRKRARGARSPPAVAGAPPPLFARRAALAVTPGCGGAGRGKPRVREPRPPARGPGPPRAASRPRLLGALAHHGPSCHSPGGPVPIRRAFRRS